MIKKEKGGFRLYTKDGSKALGPVRESKAEVVQKDEKRVQHFKKIAAAGGTVRKSRGR